MKMIQILEAVLMIFLAVFSYEDIKTNMMRVVPIAVCGGCGAVLQLISGTSVIYILKGMATGLAMLVISYAGRQEIGYGDGLMFTAAGIYLGWQKTVILLLISLLVSAVTSIILLAAGLKNRKDSIPFAPFVLAALVVLSGIY